MKCAEVTNDLLIDYSDWRLSPQDRKTIAVHLDQCRTCQVRKDEVEWMSQGVRTAVDSPPPGLLDQLAPETILQEGKPTLAPVGPPAPARPAGPRWPAFLLGAAAMLAICAAGYFVLPDLLTSTPQHSEPAVKKPDVPPLPNPEPEPETAPKPEPEPIPAPKPEPKPAPPPVRVFVKAGPTPTPTARRDVALPATPIERLVFMKPPAPPKPPDPPRVEALAGDMNGDGITDIADARSIQQSLIMGEEIPSHADMNGDGVVDVADVRHLTRLEVAGE